MTGGNTAFRTILGCSRMALFYTFFLFEVMKAILD